MRIRFINTLSLLCPSLPTVSKFCYNFHSKTAKTDAIFQGMRWGVGKFKEIKMPRRVLNAIFDFNYLIRFFA